jgi:demethylmenaquinone methyltransferase / 2-methoxy-6-polyprenyl-1,4-benzoquinol methylase
MPAKPALEAVVHAPHAPLADYYSQEGDRRGFVRALFDRTAVDYNRIERLMAFGSGPWYRRQALERAGLAPGMNALDVATGTGLVLREALALAGAAGSVVGFDLSPGMLQGARACRVSLVQGAAERLPFADRSFDFLSLGFALRHMSDLTTTFAEFHRVLRPGGRLCLLEISRPEGRLAKTLLKAYMGLAIPVLARAVGRRGETARLFRYYWDTVEACAPPPQILATLEAAGFAGVRRHVEMGIFSEYQGQKAG